jgi:predicted DNA-binding WGR domain protein
MMEVEKTELEYRAGNSDKVYIATIMEYDNGHQVVFTYGKRYNVTGRSVKPDHPVTYPEARAIAKQMIDKKLKKGYVPMS